MRPLALRPLTKLGGQRRLPQTEAAPLAPSAPADSLRASWAECIAAGRSADATSEAPSSAGGLRSPGRAAGLRALGLAFLLAAAWLCATPTPAHAGGGPENVVLVVDPTNPESLGVANYYRRVRGIPGRNTLFMRASAADYDSFVAYQLRALRGTARSRLIDDHIDYVVVAPGASFFVPAPGLIEGPCTAPVRRLSISSAYGLAYISEEILGGRLTTLEPNRYYANDDAPMAFDGRATWLNGVRSSSPNARRYLIGFMLGYTGQRGNSVSDILQMIDLSVGADATSPGGTFYLMRTTDGARSPPRHTLFPQTIASLQRLGGQAEQIEAVLPVGRHDVLGVMTGKASPQIRDADMTLLAGSYADHLTSFAGRFDTRSQVKLSEWIAKGASGSSGAVEEPCAFGAGRPGKFPHPRLFVWYFQGLSLGESLQRSVPWTPFQTLFYGDPLTQPFAQRPTVTVHGLPRGAASGTLILRPEAVPGEAGRAITAVDAYVDGELKARMAPGEALILDTTSLADGTHELVVVAYEDAAVRTQGRWRGSLPVNNRGREALIESVEPPVGDLDSLFRIAVKATPAGAVSEIRLMQAGRVVAAAAGPAAEFELPGQQFGAGSIALVAIAEYGDGRLARSKPAHIEIAGAGGQSPPLPGFSTTEAWGYTAYALPGVPKLIDLPAADPDRDAITRTVLAGPTQATMSSDGVSWLLAPAEHATGSDQLVFSATDGLNESDPVTVTIRYCTAPVIIAGAQDVDVCPGQTAQFSVAAQGAPLGYQWYRNGYPVPGGTEATLTLEAVEARQAGTYYVDVTRLCGLLSATVSSTPVTLTVAQDKRCWQRIYLPFSDRP